MSYIKYLVICTGSFQLMAHKSWLIKKSDFLKNSDFWLAKLKSIG